jgi:hypothetical protein
MNRLIPHLRLAPAAAVVAVPLLLLAAGLAVRLDTFASLRAIRPAALELNADVDTALRVAAAAVLALLGTLVIGTIARRR